MNVLRTGRSRAAVVFIHGFGGDAHATWAAFPSLVQADGGLAEWSVCTLGYSTHLAVDFVKLWSADPDLQRVALLLATEALAGELSQFESISLVAHSMGGLVAQRALLDEPALSRRVSHLFLYGTPSGGLKKASFFRRFKPAVRDMAAEGDFIRRLRADWKARFEPNGKLSLPFELFIVGGERDEFVPPESSLAPFPATLYGSRLRIVPGNHTEIVKPGQAAHLSAQVLLRGLTGDSAPSGPWNAARLAVQSRRFRQAVELLEPNREALDGFGRVQLALALEGVGRQEDAIAVLRGAGTTHTDAMGSLAGQLKRRWLASQVEADAIASQDLYERALALAVQQRRHTQVYYLAINVAFMQRVYREDREAAQQHARIALDACRSAAADEDPRDRKWRLATEGEAALILGDRPAAYAAYAAATEQDADPRELQTMFRQAIVLSRMLGDDAMRDALTRIFKPKVEPERD